jgi:hypothetical protein
VPAFRSRSPEPIQVNVVHHCQGFRGMTLGVPVKLTPPEVIKMIMCTLVGANTKAGLVHRPEWRYDDAERSGILPLAGGRVRRMLSA